MQLLLERVSYEEKETLRNLLELYRYETSAYEEEERAHPNRSGLYGYRYLDHYWTEEERHPFFIRADGKLAGFALVREAAAARELPYHAVAEFFVMRRFQRQGIGEWAAAALFDRFPGRWQVAWLPSNEPAARFWSKTIRCYTDGSCVDSDNGGQPALLFDSRRTASQ